MGEHRAPHLEQREVEGGLEVLGEIRLHQRGADRAQVVGQPTRGGATISFDLRTFYLRDLVFTGATVPPPGVFPDLVGCIERGEIRPIPAATWPLHDLVAAQEAFIAKRHIGNNVVTATSDS